MTLNTSYVCIIDLTVRPSKIGLTNGSIDNICMFHVIGV